MLAITCFSNGVIIFAVTVDFVLLASSQYGIHACLCIQCFCANCTTLLLDVLHVLSFLLLSFRWIVRVLTIIFTLQNRKCTFICFKCIN